VQCSEVALSTSPVQQARLLEDMLKPLVTASDDFKNLLFCTTDAGSSMVGGVNIWLQMQDATLFVKCVVVCENETV
jgi:hypothetical protein